MKKIRCAGFTLTELMITITIVGIVASMAVPSFSKMLERNRLKEAAHSLKNDILFARTEAIKRSQNVTVSRIIGNNGAWCYGLTTNDSCDCSASPSTCEIKSISGNDFNKTNIKSVYMANIGFDFRRGVSVNPATGANITANTCFSSTNYTVKVKTSRLGRTRICTNNNSTALIGIDYCTNSESVCAL